MRTTVLLPLLFLLSACSMVAPASPTPNLPADTPAWVEKLVSDYMAKPVENPPASIARFEYKGQVVYYVSPPCCDRYGSLFDAQGQLLCAPDGGIKGSGDGKCPDFWEQRRNEKLIWRDPRPR